MTQLECKGLPLRDPEIVATLKMVQRWIKVYPHNVNNEQSVTLRPVHMSIRIFKKHNFVYF